MQGQLKFSGWFYLQKQAGSSSLRNLSMAFILDRRNNSTLAVVCFKCVEENSCSFLFEDPENSTSCEEVQGFIRPILTFSSLP